MRRMPCRFERREESQADRVLRSPQVESIFFFLFFFLVLWRFNCSIHDSDLRGPASPGAPRLVLEYKNSKEMQHRDKNQSAETSGKIFPDGYGQNVEFRGTPTKKRPHTRFMRRTGTF